MTGMVRGAGRMAARILAVFTLIWVAACETTGVTASGPRVDASKPVPVALLVPAGSGEASDQVLAQSLENAARLAMADLSGVTIDLRVYSTGGSAENAAALAQQAVNEGARIILGPVFASEASAVGAAVRGRNVNVLSFSNNTAVAGGNVFVLGNTFENTARRIVGYARSQGITTALIAYGQDAAETRGRDAIAAAMAANGITLAGSNAVELSQMGVVNAVPEIAEQIKSTGAQALFMTSGTAGALPILSQLLRENGIDRADTRFIGLQRWDIPASALDLPGLQDGWFAQPDPALSAQFAARYTAAYGEPPHPIAGLAYDGIAAIGALVSSGSGATLGGASLTQASGFVGVNGVFRLLPDGTNERALSMAQISDRQVIVIDPAPRSFGGAGL